MDNIHRYGFRWSRANGRSCPSGEVKYIATAQNDVDDGANSVHIWPGDPVELVATGGVIVANTGETPWGIVTSIGYYWDGEHMRSGKYYPNQTVWGTVEARRGWVHVVPATAGYWEIDVDDNTTATTRAAYVALLGENVIHTCPGNTTYAQADPYLDISGHATTNTFEWRLEDISPTLDNRDFSGSYVKMIVSCNLSQQAGHAAAPGTGV
jgi:hypothetical protein